MKKSFSLSLVIATPMALALSSISIAAPQVDSLRINDSGLVQISGSGFGQGPNVVLYESFKNTQVGDDNRLNLSPDIGQWVNSGGSGSLSSGADGGEDVGLVVFDTEADTRTNLVFGVQDDSGMHGLKQFQEVFFSFDIKDEGAYPGAVSGNELSPNSSSKDAWMMFGQRGDNTQYSLDSRGEAAGHDMYIPGWTGGDFIIAGNETAMRPGFSQKELRDNWAYNDWVTMMFHGKLNPEDPYGDADGFFAFVNKNAAITNHREGGLMSDQSSDGVPPYWDRIKFNGWLRQGEAAIKRVYDNIYVAVGDNANARVVVTDSVDLTKATRITHLVPTEWEDGSITLQLPESAEGQDQYLHVIDAANEVSRPQHFCLNCPIAPRAFEVN
ncbi:MAG: hypothetical protein EA349_06995 [Halomonadaceae bacterium]|nr:MAG: hypothetical protein EA349_06995 [Halomonadaceae bacterium]